MDTLTRWSVATTRSAEGQILDPNDETLHDQVSDLMELLSDYGAAVSYSSYRYTVRLAVEASSAGTAVSEALGTVQRYAEEAGLPSWPFVKVEATEWSAFERELETPTFPNVLGVSELSQLLGVSRQRASELARSRHFPKPFAALAAGPVWLEPSISRFVREWERRPGRPKSEAI